MSNNGEMLINREIAKLSAAMAGWSSNLLHSGEKKDDLFADLKSDLNHFKDYRRISPKTLLTPFLRVIQHEEAQDAAISVAMEAVFKFLRYGLIYATQANIGSTMESIANAFTNTRFLTTDQLSDCVTLFPIINIIPVLVQSRTCKALPEECLEDIMKSCLKIYSTPYLNASLRQAAEEVLEFTVELMFDGSSEFSKSHSNMCFSLIIHLCYPHKNENADLKILIGLRLLTVALKVGAEFIGKKYDLLDMIEEHLYFYLVALMASENIEVFASALQVGFLIFESLLIHLEFQLECYLTKLLELTKLVAGCNPRQNYTKLKITLEHIHQLWQIPGFIQWTYNNSTYFDDFLKLLSALTLSDSNSIDSTRFISNDILICTIEMIAKYCQSANSGRRDNNRVGREMFCIVWHSSLPAFSLVFDKSNENEYQRVLTGFKEATYIAAYYNLQDICKSIVLTLCKFTNLLQSNGSPDTAPAVNFGLCPKAQAALTTLFTILHEHGERLGASRDHIIQVISQLVMFNLLPTLEKKCLDQIITYTSSARHELVFLGTFIDFLSTSKYLQSIITDLSLKSFHSGELSFHRLCQNILGLKTATYGTDLNALQEATASLNISGNMYFLGKLKETIGDYIKPVEIKETTADNRKVLQVVGKNILISTILQAVEGKLSNRASGIEEVHFIVTEILHVDVDLTNQFWHGMNIVVLTKKLKIHNQVNWNVSGLDSSVVHSGDAGTAANGHGKQGEDGTAGESGGNILILTDDVENAVNLTITSSGGDGSNGQDGGHGKDGADGKSLTKQRLIDDFPSVIRFACIPSTRADLRQVTYDRIGSNSTVHEHWRNDGHVFIRATTNEGNEITFSFCRHVIFSSVFQAFLFYGGSPGQEGCSGGANGLGGEGGYAGDVIVKNLKTDKTIEIAASLKNGSDGDPGKGGKYGSRGKNGNDMGYVDYQTWSEAVYCDNGRKYKLQYYDEGNMPDDSVWCPRKQQYAAIRPANVENKRVMENRRNVRVNAERKHHAQAERKKNISQNSILNRYSQRHSSTSSEKQSLQNMRSNLLNIEQQASQAITEDKKQQQQTHTAQVRIQRGSSYLNVRQPPMRSTAETLTTAQTSNESNNANQIVEALKRNPLSLDAWYNLKDVELSSLQLEQIFPLIKASKLKHNRTAEKILLGKYRYVTLHAIATHLQPYTEVPEDPELTPTIAVRYLIPRKNDYLEVHHPSLGPLGEYLFEEVKSSEAQRRKIIDFCNKHIINKDTKTLKSSVRAFILEVVRTHKTYKKYHEKYQNLLDKQKRGFIIFPESFDNLDNFCCNDKQLLKDYLKHLEIEGTGSGSYRELLAYIFDANIRLYTETDDNKLSLYNCHNPTATQYTHALCRDRQFIPLQIDKNYLRLEEERKLKDLLYKKILKETEAFEKKQQLDAYLSNRTFDNLLGCGCEDSEISESELYSSEQHDIEKILKYFPDEEDQLILRTRLEAIKFRFIGQRGILHSIQERFSTEGRHVSFQELCYLISSVMTSRVKSITEKNTFSWIISAYPQRNWINELILLQLENHFKGFLADKSKWRSFLSNITNKDVLLLFVVQLEQHQAGDLVSVESIGDILYLLSSIPNESIDLGDFGLSEWPYLLKEKYWSYKLSHLTNWTTGNSLIASYHLLSMENIFGTDLVEKFLSILGGKSPKLSSDTLTSILANFSTEKWNLGTLELESLTVCTVVEWTDQLNAKFNADKEDRDIGKLVDIVKGNANTSKVISESLTTIAKAIKDIYQRKRQCSENDTEDAVRYWVQEFQMGVYPRTQSIESRAKILAVIDRAIRIKKRFSLRDTQKLSILALLTNNGSTLAQVATGEGKSLIVVAISILKALFGEKVHIITSSPVLAKRDAEENADLYSMFGITVSHNCNEDIEKRKDAYSKNQVIYGDLSNFQRDFLLDRFYGKNIWSNHKFNNVIVDEVDSMLLDNGNNMLYLSHDLADFNRLESLYVYIWQWINQPTDNYEDAKRVFDPKRIKTAILYDLYGVITAKDIQKLGPELTKVQQTTIFDRLVQAGILDDQGRLLRQTIENGDLEELLAPEFSLYQDRLLYLLYQCINRVKRVHIPNYLRPFAEQHLESWINSAVTAFFMKTGHDYVVDVDRTGTSSDRNPNITIIDRDTGTDQANSQWDEALHQFLQLKHGCKLTLQTLKAVFISNVSFLKRYSHLYGLTGTLGSKVERDLLRQIHDVAFVTIPTAKEKKFYEDDTIVCVDSNQWIANILAEAQKITQEKGRSVLIICETVNDVETLHKAFSRTNAQHVHTYRRDYEEFDIAKGSKALGRGRIIIATNLAGRGTDIKLTSELRNAGGLHVCLTYLPNNKRIEQQALGRAARSGDPGSGQLIILIESDVKNYNSAQILHLKRLRDNDELRRISDIKKYYETQIITEEKCFKRFSDQYKRLKFDLDVKEIPNEIKDILLQSCLDKWAFWIDTNSKRIKHLKSAHFNGQLNQFISTLQELQTDNCVTWIEKYPVHMVKLGKYYAQNKKHIQAIELFDRVIKQEPNFSEAAHYYKAFALSKEINWSEKPFAAGDNNKKDLKMLKQELRATARLLDERRQFSANAAAIVGKVMKNNKESMVQIDAYEEQHKCLGSLYSVYMQNINAILGQPVSAQAFIKCGISEEEANILFKELLTEGILRNLRVKRGITTIQLKSISCNYKIPLETLTGFLSMYEGKEIDQQQFGKALKKQIILPSREAFWKFLIEKEILSNQIKYVILSTQKLEAFDATLFETLKEKVRKNALENQTLECEYRQIFLRAEKLSQHNKDDYVFKKADFLTVVTKDKYQLLKKKGIIFSNRKADTDVSKITTSTVFSSFDSIAVADFVNLLNMTEKEAGQVFEHLISGNVIAADQSQCGNDNIYRLKVQFDKFDEIKLPLFPLYEQDVKGLLSVCFAYRIALQKLAKKLEEDSESICLHLMTKPHQILLMELLTDAIVKPVIVNKFTKYKLAEILKRLGIIKEDESKNMLIASLKSLGESEQLKTVLGRLNLTAIKIDEIPLYQLRQISQGLGLSGDDPILTNINTLLTQSRSSLKVLKSPDSKLEPLTDHIRQYECIDTAEIRVFFLSAFEHLIQLEEEKWSREMLINTAIVFLMGTVQLVVGIAIDYYSFGAMSHVGQAFINEGISDMFYATSALCRGYFDWSDYGQYKIESLTYTALTVGMAAYSGPPTFQSTVNSAGKEILTRFFFQALKTISFGFANAGVDYLIENHLAKFAKGIGAQILSNIDCDVGKHDISKTLENAYRTLGKEQARQLVENVTKSILTEKLSTKEYLNIADWIASSVIQHIFLAATKTKKNSSERKIFQFAVSKITTLLVWEKRLQHLQEMTNFTNNLLNSLETKLKQEMEKLSRNANQTNSDIHLADDEGCDDFTKGTIYEWKQLLKERAGNIILQNIVSPIMKTATYYIVQYVGNSASRVYQSYKQSGNHDYDHFDNVKTEYKENQQKEEYEQKKQQHQEERKPNFKALKHFAKKWVEDLREMWKNKNYLEMIVHVLRGSFTLYSTFQEGMRSTEEKVEHEKKVTTGKKATTKEEEIAEFKEFLKTVKIDDTKQIVKPKKIVETQQYMIMKQIETMSSEILAFDYGSTIQRLMLNSYIQRAHARTAAAEMEESEDFEETLVGQGTGGDRDPNEMENLCAFEPSNVIKIPASKVYDMILNQQILLSQDSIKDHTTEDLYVGDMAANMLKSGYNGDPIRAVVIGGKLVVLDHRRLVAAALARSDTVLVPFAIYLPEDTLNSQVLGTTNAGEAVRRRMNRGRLRNYDGVGFPSSVVRIRTCDDKNPQNRVLYENKLRNLNFIVVPRPRSNSIACSDPDSRNKPRPKLSKKWSSTTDLKSSNKDNSNNT